MQSLRTILICFGLLAPCWATAGESAHSMFCPHCHEACYPTVTKGTETRHCWQIQTKAICIPRVSFPWQLHHAGKGHEGCPEPARCGRVKHVSVLVRLEFECPKCQYNWTAEPKAAAPESVQDPVPVVIGDVAHGAVSQPASAQPEPPVDSGDGFITTKLLSWRSLFGSR